VGKGMNVYIVALLPPLIHSSRLWFMVRWNSCICCPTPGGRNPIEWRCSLTIALVVVYVVKKVVSYWFDIVV
jgi:hypothetical protein